MFKSFFKKIEDSIKSTGIQPNPQTAANTTPDNNNATVTTAVSPQQQEPLQTQQPPQQQPQPSIRTLSLSPGLNLSYQPVVDASKYIKESVQPVTDALKDSLKLEVDTFKELTEKDIPVMFQTVTNLTSSVTATPYLPSIAQVKDSLSDVDLYNGSLLLRSYEIKLKQIRTNGVILSEKAEEVDKKFPAVIKSCNFQYESWLKSIQELSKIEEINNMIESVHLNIDSIISKIESLEIALSIDIDTHLESEHLKWRERKDAEFQRYETSKKLELNKLQEDLSLAHQRHEREKLLQERQALLELERQQKKIKEEEIQRKIEEEARLRANLDKTIQKQLSEYKLTGSLPTNNNNNNDTTTPTTTAIENIVPEDNKEELESFLESSSSSSDTTPKEEENSNTTILVPSLP
eukprot:gene8496-10441_t